MDSRTLLRQIRYRPVTLIPRKRVVSLYPGEWPSPFEGKGFEPLRFREFAMGDDPRRLHVPTSTRRGRPMLVERVALRDLRVLVVVDPSPSMRVRTKLEVQIAAAALLLYSAWQAETTFGLAVQRGPNVQTFGLGIGSRHFHRLYRTLWDLFSDRSRSPAGRRMPLSRALPPNAMLLYCSDFLGADGAPSDLRAFRKTVQRFDVVPIVIQDEFEWSFPVVPAGTFLHVSNPETGERDEIWISRAEATKIRALHEARFQQLTIELAGGAAQCIHLATAHVPEIVRRIDVFFQRRQRRLAS